MATYKVIQDIEAEDKLVGPLTFRQFVYAGIAALNFYLTFLVSSKGAAFAAVIFFPIGLVFAFLAWPWSRDQPTEIWALARFRFLLKPRRRIWDQSGVKELVTITVPPKIERNLTNGLSQTEVKSRLRALADTIDSRGWAIKNVNVSLYGQPALISNDPSSDRLVNLNSLPQPVESVDIKPAEDMLDVQNNPVAQQFDSMIAASEKAHRAEVIEKMQAAAAPAIQPPPLAAPSQPAPLQPVQTNDYWFLNQPSQSTSSIPQDNVTFNTQVVAPGASSSTLPVAAAVPTADEETFIKSHRNEPAFSPNLHGHLHVIQPLSAQQAGTAQGQGIAPQQTPMPPTNQSDDRTQTGATQGVQNPATPPVTQQRDTAILDLARNDDLNVATLAREAQKRTGPSADEVVISLH